MSVDPSSLIFVVIIGIWALYLVQHWVRRREQVATSRSVDRFSEAMRVLERRAPIPIELPARSTRPYAVAAKVVTAANVVRPEVAMPQAPNSRPDTRPDSRPDAGRPAARTIVPRRRTHRLRALIFLTLLVATPSVWLAHEFGTLLLWPTVTVTVLFVVDLLLVRSAARRERALPRRAIRMAGRPEAVRRVARPATSARPAPAASDAKPFPAAAASRGARAGAPSRVRLDSTARTSSPAAAAAHSVTAEAQPMASSEAITEVILREGEWAPVAVPLPTYTMKAKADRPSSPSSPLVAESDSAPVRQPSTTAEPVQPAIVIDEFDLDSVLDRRRAAGE